MESCWKPGYKAERWVHAQSDAVDTVMVEMCRRAPSSAPTGVSHRASSAGCCSSGICFSPSWTTPSPLLHAGSGMASPLSASPVERGVGNIPHPVCLQPLLSVHPSNLLPSQESSPAPRGRQDVVLGCSSAEVSMNKAPGCFHSTR